ncbi:hypothetical protein [Muricoprocola aceti]|uniref:Uncharacterized protein n=1 Tax=Muricoprocola aceti TaxID=2981772 RepID=A0ABT2SIG8_9FIRM|nr:hypothetical protein [Muricoprocola aceti]MCU6724292.1 hypothetical protein [Muricoprocola aceti]
MRNKYAALALGMALTITAMPVMAASTTNTATTERSAKSDDASTHLRNRMGKHLDRDR